MWKMGTDYSNRKVDVSAHECTKVYIRVYKVFIRVYISVRKSKHKCK